mmetsp:Transcript_33123/g.102280  ORF Transcript_33123/g.102280 Transcript_33123/m.102280 type:complete len:295 (+) Transcript_33123:1448-2332(+)
MQATSGDERRSVAPATATPPIAVSVISTKWRSPSTACNGCRMDARSRGAGDHTRHAEKPAPGGNVYSVRPGAWAPCPSAASRDVARCSWASACSAHGTATSMRAPSAQTRVSFSTTYIPAVAIGSSGRTKARKHTASRLHSTFSTVTVCLGAGRTARPPATVAPPGDGVSGGSSKARLTRTMTAENRTVCGSDVATRTFIITRAYGPRAGSRLHASGDALASLAASHGRASYIGSANAADTLTYGTTLASLAVPSPRHAASKSNARSRNRRDPPRLRAAAAECSSADCPSPVTR